MPHVVDNTVKRSASYRIRPCRQEREIQIYADGVQNVKWRAVYRALHNYGNCWIYCVNRSKTTSMFVITY